MVFSTGVMIFWATFGDDGLLDRYDHLLFDGGDDGLGDGSGDLLDDLSLDDGGELLFVDLSLVGSELLADDLGAFRDDVLLDNLGVNNLLVDDHGRSSDLLFDHGGGRSHDMLVNEHRLSDLLVVFVMMTMEEVVKMRVLVDGVVVGGSGGVRSWHGW